MKKWLTITALLLTSSEAQAIPACEGIDLTELKERFLSEVHNEHDYKAFKPYKWKICARTLGTTLYKEEKDKADKIKEAQAAKDNEDANKEEEDKENKKEEGEKEGEDESEGASKEDKVKPDENKKIVIKEGESKLDENPDENKEAGEKEGGGKDKEDDNKTDETKKDKKFSVVETDIANHYLHRVYPHYPSP